MPTNPPFGGATNAKQLESYVSSRLASLPPDIRRLAEYASNKGFKQDSQFLKDAVGETDSFKLKQALGMSDEEYNAFTNALYAVKQGTGDQFLQKYTAETGATLGGTPQGAGPAPGSQPGDVNQRAAITAQIQDFYKRMTAPVTDSAGNITEPIVKQLATIGRSMGLQGASGSGIQGGAASAAGSASAMANSLPYLQQRASLAAGANQLLQNGQMGYEASNQNLQQLNMRAQEMQNDVTQANYQNQTNQAQGLGSTLGAVAGTLGTALTGIPGLDKVGSNFGASLGGQTVAQPKYAPYKPYSGNSGS